MRFLLGLDDTDSRFGHCTTHLGFLIVRELTRIGCAFPTYPRLVRLNPNVPFKTRGNAAVCIEFESHDAERAFLLATNLLRAESDVKNGANAALAMVHVESEAGLVFARRLYQRAIRGVVNYRGVLHDIASTGIRHTELGNGMGIVGAVASMGFPCLEDDHTYELIAYRLPENCGTRRRIEPQSVRTMEQKTFPHTFNNFDHESGRVLLAPTGPDPVLLGVRGDSPQTVLGAFRKIRVDETMLGHVIYATNQCTDAHLRSRMPTPLSAYSSGWLEGLVASKEPKQGGHLMISLRLEDNSLEECWVYEPVGDLRRIANLLSPEDKIRVSGGVRRASARHPRVINVEKIEVVSTKSGSNRGIRPGTYLASPRAQRHLTKQLIRFGNEVFTDYALVGGWFELGRRLETARIA